MVEQKPCAACKVKPRHKNYSRCHECYNAYYREYMARRYKERRALAYELLGEACEDCGTTENLDIDHVVAKDKLYEFDWLYGQSLARFKAEIIKCALRCKPCHIKKTNEYGDGSHPPVKHGGGVSGKRHCPCDLCKAKRAEYMRNYKRKRARAKVP